MRSLALLAILAALACSAASQNADARDVCVLGGGASGMAAAVFLKDRGYNPLVFESASVVGGHCHTTPTPGKGVGYYDSGVKFLMNTSYANSTYGRGLGFWSVDAIAFVKRFLGPNVIIPVDFSATNSLTYVLDLSKGGIQQPPLTPEQQDTQGAALTAAITDIYTFMLTRGEFFVTGQHPEPVPAELLAPFLQTVAERNWWAFVLGPGSFVLQASGFAPLERLTTLEALKGCNAMVLDMFTRPGSAFAIAGGCNNLYEAMRGYIGAQNVILNADIKSVHRPYKGVSVRGFVQTNDNRQARLPNSPFSMGASATPAQPFNVQCKSVVVAFPPLLQNMEAFQLFEEEEELFSLLQAHYYLAMVANYTGGSLSTEPGQFSIFNLNFTNLPTLQSKLPNLSLINRDYPGVGGWVGAWANADGAVSFDEIMAAVRRDFAVVGNSGLLTGLNAISAEYHYYAPYWNPANLAVSPTPYARLRALQGQRNTYYVSAFAAGVDSTPNAWDQAYKLVDANFPRKA